MSVGFLLHIKTACSQSAPAVGNSRVAYRIESNIEARYLEQRLPQEGSARKKSAKDRQENILKITVKVLTELDWSETIKISLLRTQSTQQRIFQPEKETNTADSK